MLDVRVGHDDLVVQVDGAIGAGDARRSEPGTGLGFGEPHLEADRRYAGRVAARAAQADGEDTGENQRRQRGDGQRRAKPGAPAAAVLDAAARPTDGCARAARVQPRLVTKWIGVRSRSLTFGMGLSILRCFAATATQAHLWSEDSREIAASHREVPACGHGGDPEGRRDRRNRQLFELVHDDHRAAARRERSSAPQTVACAIKALSCCASACAGAIRSRSWRARTSCLRH